MRVAIYCRLSKEDTIKNDESESIKNQKKLLTSFALNNDWEIVQYYVDEDYKGSDRERPEFNKLLRDAEGHHFDIILCKSQARFCRDLELIEKYLHGKFLEWGIRFISVVDRADTDDRANKKSRQIIGLKDEWYLEDLSDDIRRVLNQKRKDGVYIASWALYGYQKDPDNKGHLIIDPETVDVVQEIYEMYLNGDGMQKIASNLNARGIDCPSLYKQKKGLRSKPAHYTPKAMYWNVGAVYSILTQRMYTGDMVQGRMKKLSYKSKKLVRVPKEQWYIVPNTHEAIISHEMFDKVQEIRQSRSKPKDGKRHIFSGKVYCMECGQSMSSGRYPQKNKEGQYTRYLKCSARAVNKELCIGSSILMGDLEKYILTEVNNLAVLYFSEDALSKKVILDQENKKAAELAKLQKEFKAAQKDISMAAETFKKLYMDRVNGVLSESEFLMLKQSIAEDELRNQRRIENIQERMSLLQQEIQKTEDRKSVIDKYRELDHLTREVLDQLVERIYVSHKDKDTKRRTIKIVWAI